MSRPALVSLPLVEAVESHDRLLATVGSDGVITMDEWRRVVRSAKSISRKAQRIHDGFRFQDLLIHGDGVDGEWIKRLARRDMKDRLYLVRNEDDGPEPSGPAGMKAA